MEQLKSSLIEKQNQNKEHLTEKQYLEDKIEDLIKQINNLKIDAE